MRGYVTDLEAFRATVEHRRCGRILYYASFTPDLERRVREHIGRQDIAAHYGFYEPVSLDIPRPAGVPPLDYSRYWHDQTLPEGTRFDEFGVAMAPSGFYHFWKYVSPLRNARSLSEIENYPLEDYSTWDSSSLPGQVAAAHGTGKVAVGWVGHMYETAWQIRGYEQFLMDLIDQPAWAECLLERLFRQNLARAVAFAKAGADCLRCGDDVANQRAMMFSPDTWRAMIFSRWSGLWATVKSIQPDVKIWYHSDGNIQAVIGEMVDAGLDILNPLQPECLEVDAVYARFNRRLCLDGCIGTQSTMPHGSPDDVRRRVEEVIDKYGRNGGLIVSPTHVLEPDVPIANIDAFAEACRRYGQ
jgi:uroporphyrinogen decarboxylase